MICNRCGANVPEGINFCIKCGSDLRHQTPAPAPQAAPVNAPAPAVQPQAQQPVYPQTTAQQPAVQPQAQQPVYPQTTAQQPAAQPRPAQQPAAQPRPAQQPAPQPRPAQQPAAQPGAQPVQTPGNPVPVPQPVAVPSAEVNRAPNQPPRQNAPKQKAPKAPKDKAAKKSSGLLAPFIIVLILAVIFAACFALLYFNVFDFWKKSPADKTAEVSDSADTGDTGDTGKTGNEDDTALSAKAERYDAVVDFFSEDTPHVGSDRFYADTPVVVLSMKDESATFGITANFIRQASVSFTAGSDVASFEWTEESWKKNTDIRVTPKAPGTTIITFANDLNEDTFQVLVIVTE